MRHMVNTIVVCGAFLGLVIVEPASGANLKMAPKVKKLPMDELADRVAHKALEGEKNPSADLLRQIKRLATDVLTKNREQDIYTQRRPEGMVDNEWALDKAALHLTWATVVELGLNHGNCTLTQFGSKANILGPCRKEREILMMNKKLNGAVVPP